MHAVVATPANVHDSQVLADLLHGEETRVWGDAAYAGQREVMRERAPKAKDFTQEKSHRHRALSDEQRAKNRTKSKVRAKVEHAIGVIKRVIGFAKVRYRGLAKNAHRLFVACALANLFTWRGATCCGWRRASAASSGGCSRPSGATPRKICPPATSAPHFVSENNL